jgi:predicted unusual protein kinase regulating ubiquinone biosynthesis (AarF/ABC1/UbiB family)
MRRRTWIGALGAVAALSAALAVRYRRPTGASRVGAANSGLSGAGVTGLRPSGTAAAGLGVAATTRLARGRTLLGLTTRIGVRRARNQAELLFASAQRRPGLRAEQQLRTTEEAVAALGSMKGALMKLGQMASYLDAGLPEEVRRSLSTLQADAAPMTAELAASVICEELGAPPEEIFERWDPMPMAAASIGQVHKAITKDGRAVAVKVQYPGVDEAIRADLDNGALLLSLLRAAFPSLDAASLLEELRARIGEELDYRLEASNQQRFATMFQGHPFIHIPAVLPELSARRVLTTELVVGATYDEVTKWPQEERDKAGEAIFRFVFDCLYRLSAFNGDPHPGNYLFHGDGRVSFLDFGLVKWFEPEDINVLVSLIKTLVLAGDEHGFREAIEKAGFLRPDPALSDEEVSGYFRHYYELVRVDEVMECSPEYASETLRRFFDATNPVLKRANVPPQFVVVQRINLGLYAVLAGLHARANWRAVAEEIWPFVARPATTALGRAEAAWRAGGPV